MPKISFSSEQIDQLLEEVGGELRKDAQDDAPVETSQGSSGPTDPEPEAEPEVSASPAPEGSGPPPEASAPPPGPEMSGGPDDGTIAPAPTVEQLQAEYVGLPPDQLKMHFVACKAAMEALMTGAGAASPDMGGGPPPGAAPPPPGPEMSGAGAPPPAFKAEIPAGTKVAGTEGNGSDVTAGKAAKSEKDLEIARLKKSVEDGQQALESFKSQMEAEMGRFVSVAEKAFPVVRKSITGVSEIRHISRETAAPVGGNQPAKPLTKSEVKEKLKKHIRSGTLSSADKELVVGYDLGKTNVEQLQHLLSDAK